MGGVEECLASPAVLSSAEMTTVISPETSNGDQERAGSLCSTLVQGQDKKSVEVL